MNCWLMWILFSVAILILSCNVDFCNAAGSGWCDEKECDCRCFRSKCGGLGADNRPPCLRKCHADCKKEKDHSDKTSMHRVIVEYSIQPPKSAGCDCDCMCVEITCPGDMKTNRVCLKKCHDGCKKKQEHNNKSTMHNLLHNLETTGDTQPGRAKPKRKEPTR